MKEEGRPSPAEIGVSPLLASIYIPCFVDKAVDHYRAEG